VRPPDRNSMSEPADGEDGDRRVELSVPEMDCASCAATVGDALDDADGVEDHEERAATGKLVAVLSPGATVDGVVAAVEAAGYSVADADASGSLASAGRVWTGRRALKTWVGAALLAVGLVLEFLLPGLDAALVAVGATTVHLADALFLGAVAAGGQEIVAGGVRSARAVRLDIDLLMSLAIFGALAASLGFGESLYFEAATLAVLFSVAELLETYSMEQARTSLRELMALSPDEATRLVDGEETVVPVDDLVVGDVVAVRPGESIPVDGVVLEGTSPVDQSPVTGESVPVDKTAGDEVYAGTVVEGGYLEVEVTAAPGEDTLSRVVELVEEASAGTTDREQFVERFADVYTPVVVAVAVVVAAGPPLLLGAPGPQYLVYGLTLLVLACPCAFVIATPVSVVAGVTSAARNGVLVKGGDTLEAAGEVGAVAVDKTGTLTRGELAVTDVVPMGDHTAEEVLATARGVEARSEHPIGEAIVERAAEAGAQADPVDDFEALTGRGVRADLDGRTHYAGAPSLFADLGFDLNHVHAATDGGRVTTRSRELCERANCLDLLDGLVPDLQSAGKTVVLVGTEAELVGVVAVADELRPEAPAAVERLRDLGVERVVMLTGDNERTARAVGEAAGVDEVRAELMPEEKVETVRELDAAHDGVMMVGDGVNDAPALATATVGVAMGAAGTDTAIETADVALMADDLSRLPYLYDLSRRAGSVIRTNVWASLAAKVVLAAGVPFGLVPIWVAVLVGDAGMTTAVTGNAMRLSRVVPEALVPDDAEPALPDDGAAPAAD
jgi:Cd2+/Zn2+-exporting ATPase